VNLETQSILERLTRRAKNEHRLFQDVLALYGIERTLYRLSQSRFSSSFILKGGTWMNGWFGGKLDRVTADIDVVGRKIPNQRDSLIEVFREILAIPCREDCLEYDFSSISCFEMNPGKDYPVITMGLTARLGTKEIPISIDIGFGDPIFPESVDLAYPTLLGFPVPVVKAYSKESVIAEKFQAMVFLGEIKTRYKDFYDIYLLSQKFSFEGHVLSEALAETFTARKTAFTPIVCFSPAFYNSGYHSRQWKSFVNRNHIDPGLSLELVILHIGKFLTPIVTSLVAKKAFHGKWVPPHSQWEERA